MPLINSVYGLPTYNVDRLSESESRQRSRDRKKDKKEEKSQSTESVSEDKSQTEEVDLSLEKPEPSQTLDTETVVKLLDGQSKNQNQIDNASLTASTRYGHVKNLTNSSKFIREI
ncbi:MAG: hypothetical protein ACKN9V_10600 [Pseudomonadota bacterium]